MTQPVFGTKTLPVVMDRRHQSGANVVYERHAFERAVGTLNGYDFEPLV